MKTLLLVEDDTSLGATLKERLTKEGFNVLWARSQNEGESLFQTSDVDLAIIDVGLPDGNGFEFAKKMKSFRPTPFIFVTAMNSAEYRLAGYELGADEYIPKPFHLRELLLRIRKVLDTPRSNATLKIHDMVIDLNSMSVSFRDGHTEYITARDFQILKCLIETAPKVVSRDELIQLIHKDPNEALPTQRTIDNSIVRLRQILKAEDKQIIRSVRGVGYQWLGQE